MLDVGGQDATEAFEDVGHSDEARETLEQLLIGKLKRQVSSSFPAQQRPEPKPPFSANLFFFYVGWRPCPQGLHPGQPVRCQHELRWPGLHAVRRHPDRWSRRLRRLPVHAKPGADQGISARPPPSRIAHQHIHESRLWEQDALSEQKDEDGRTANTAHRETVPHYLNEHLSGFGTYTTGVDISGTNHDEHSPYITSTFNRPQTITLGPLHRH